MTPKTTPQGIQPQTEPVGWGCRGSQARVGSPADAPPEGEHVDRNHHPALPLPPPNVQWPCGALAADRRQDGRRLAQVSYQNARRPLRTPLHQVLYPSPPHPPECPKRSQQGCRQRACEAIACRVRMWKGPLGRIRGRMPLDGDDRSRRCGVSCPNRFGEAAGSNHIHVILYNLTLWGATCAVHIVHVSVVPTLATKICLNRSHFRYTFLQCPAHHVS